MITLDTGALLPIERRRPAARALLEVAWRERLRVTVPAGAWGEWHAGRRGRGLGPLADAVVIEPLTAALAKSAGEALAALRLSSVHFLDASVMATAARLGDVVYGGDVDDFERLAQYFSGVRVRRV